MPSMAPWEMVAMTLKCDECGRFMSEPAEVLSIRDAVHPYTADYHYLCAHCVAERGA